jgi:hypothetical protein
MKLEQTAPLTLPPAGAARAMLAVAVPGALGLAVVIRTLFVYLGHDLLASLIVVAMGAGLAVGLAELTLRVRRAVALRAEAQGLPTLASESLLERVSPELRAMLRARLELTPMPTGGESLTPYLVGLMVMLGLLGTLLGLFETLGGAGHVLTESGNVDALRSGLAGPLRGLTRSFGCSAAGVSASAMLGLAAVLVRRHESQALRAVLAYATGPWRELSPVRRQLTALERLSSQGDSLPRAADALAQAAERIDALAGRWDEAHQRATAAQQKSLSEVFVRLEGELGKSAASASRAVSETVAPLLTRLVTETGAAAAKQLSTTFEVVDRELAARRSADAELRGVLGEQLAALASLRGELGQLLQASAREAEARAERERSAEARHAEAMVREAEARSAREQAQDARHLEAMTALAQGGRTLEEATARSGKALEETTARTGKALEETTSRTAKALEDTLARQEQAMNALLETGAQQLSRLGELSTEGARDALARLVSVTDQQAARFADLDAQLEARQLSLAEKLAAVTEQQAGRLVQLEVGFETRQVALAEKLAGVAEQQAERFVRLEAGFETRQVALAEKLVGVTEQQAARFTELEERLELRQLELAEKLAGVTEQQAARFTELEGRLEASQAELAQKLASELVGQAQRMGEGLAGTTALVGEAASVLKASSIEMGAVAELFAKSVERQREAAQAWLESLGEVESAVERAGRGAAADALGDQLASTQEVFARQLQFQRELFEQLRSLRPGTVSARDAHEEQDASA